MRAMLAAMLMLVVGVVGAAAAPPDVPAAQQARYHALIAQLRCVICQNRSIAESDAPLAADMRHLVARQMRSGKSDAEIKDFLVERYGSFVLYNPRFNASTWLLWLGPAGLLVIAVLVVLLLLRRGRRQPEPPAPDSRELERILERDAD